MFEDKNAMTVTWINKQPGNLEGFYHTVAFQIASGGGNTEVCRATLQSDHDPEDRFDLVITRNLDTGGITYRADCYDVDEETGELEEYPLNAFLADDGGEILLVCDDEGERIYFHIY
jgi:hypothetical protein